jgi:type IV secretion system protein VirD4
VAASPFTKKGDHALHIGSFSDGTPLTYSGDGSIATIAPPGSGKTQCNVFPNLLTWTGPAVVLDISGDIYEHTAAWRAANVGPVYKFSPLEPEASHKYNPLTFVRGDPDYIWEDSRLLAEMMIVPSLSSDPFWENEARTVLTAAIAHVCYSNPPRQRPMYAVLDALYGGSAWDDMILGLRLAVDVRVMTQHANALSSMNEKTLSSVLQTARSSLGAWAGERVARATSDSDWSPHDLRSGSNPTIYIYIRPNEVEAYLSLLRVFIGQHIRMLTGGAVPPPGAPPILFMLDELPRLRNMPPVDEALNIGRKYGLRLWMFAQSVGQLQTAYDNADGMLGSCAVRIFMNPSGADGLAEKISEELGYVESLNDNSRRRLVEAADLAGPTYRDRQIVIANGAKPVIVSKDFAYRSAELASRMNAHH